MVFMVFMVFIIFGDDIMKSIKQQIIQAKQEKTERNKESWYVDYCNNCKTGLSSEHDVPCHHPYYCWHEGESADVQAGIVAIDEHRRLYGYITAQMREEYKQLRNRQAKIIGKGKAKTLRG